MDTKSKSNKTKRQKCDALGILIKHIDSIKNTTNHSKSMLDEINRDNRLILKEINAIKKSVGKK